MAEPHVISALKAKQDEIKKRISNLKKEIKACRNDLETVTRVMRISRQRPAQRATDYSGEEPYQG